MLEILSTLYLLIPAWIFLIGWLKPTIAIAVSVLLIIAFVKYVKELHLDIIQTKRAIPRTSSKKTVVISILLIFWVVCSGTGGIIWQNTWDHKFRNAIFADLVAYSWPITNNGNGLCYYIGFWMPAALVGKMFGLEVGYLFQTVWACFGVLLAIQLIFRYLGSQKLRTVILLILYSGLDVCIYFAVGIVKQRGIQEMLIPLLQGKHLELLTNYFNSSSNTTLLFWLYNQIIPFWVGFMLILTQQKNKAFPLIFALMIFFCPFPCVGMLPVIVYLYMKNHVFHDDNGKTVLGIVKRLLTPANLSLIPFLLVLALYYTSNVAVNKIAGLQLDLVTICLFVAYFVCEYGVYLWVIYPKNKRDPILNILLVTTLICSFVVMGDSYDFAWRTCIPLAFYIMLLIAKELNNISLKTVAATFLIICLSLGAVTPVTEFLRTMRMEIQVLQGEESAKSDSLATVFTRENNECYENFIGNTESIFFEYLCK